jgi:hypothetical protein
MLAQITLAGINFLPEIILTDFCWEYIHKLECVNKMFISPSLWRTPVDMSVEWPKTEIWGWAKYLLCFSFLFTHLSHLNP